MIYFYLIIAVISEVCATVALKESMGLTRWPLIIIMILGYGLSLYFLNLVIKIWPIGITYALWSGFGIVVIMALGIIFYREIPDPPAIIGITFIIIGAVIIRLYSTLGTIGQ